MKVPEKLHWDATGATQSDLMKSDVCILVDKDDSIRGYASKMACHTFNELQPEGRLHRAFSVFLFNSEGKLMLQRRAGHKITFPSVWTNTCCSHQLFTEDQLEVDQQEDIVSGKIPGTIRAARRKLHHELGIDCTSFLDEDFKFITRIKYAAKDVDSMHIENGRASFWGEAEVDYIVFLQKDLAPHLVNSEEVSEISYVDAMGLKQLLADSRNSWSPWFRKISDRFLFNWWENLPQIFDASCNSQRDRRESGAMTDWTTVHQL